MLPLLPNLDGLIGLGQTDGVDIRPTLLRVLTDLYVQRPGHTLEEEARYTELALSLLSSADVVTRAAIAGKLAHYPEAPRPVVQKLSRDVFDVAEPILLHSPCLKAQDLLYVLKECDSRYAAAIAARVEQQRRGNAPAGVQADVGTARGHESMQPRATERQPTEMAASQQPAVAQEIRNEKREFTRHAGIAKSDRAPAPSKPARSAVDESPPPSAQPRYDHAPAPSKPARVAVDEPPPPPARPRYEHVDAFFAATAAGRRAILSKVQAEGSLWPGNLPLSPIGDDVDRLETDAFHHRTENVARELEQALRLPYETARRIVEDDGGESFVVVAKALAMPAHVFTRIILFLNPKVGRSVERVFALVKLFNELTVETAARVVSSWREPSALDRTAARYQPVHWDDQKAPAPPRPSRIDARRFEPALAGRAASAVKRRPYGTT